MSAGYKSKRNRRKLTTTQPVSDAVRLDTVTTQTTANFQSGVDKMLAVGVARHTLTNSRTPTSFLNDVNDYSDPNLKDRKATIGLARKLRAVEGICSTVGDLLADFAITRGSFHSDNEELKIILNRWANFVNSSPSLTNTKGVVFSTPGIRAFARKAFDDYVTDGDAVFTSFWEKGVKMDPNSTDKPLFLPTVLKGLDVTSLIIDEDLAKIGIERIELKLDDKLVDKIVNPKTEADKYLKKLIPKEWMKFINQKTNIVLDPNNLYHIKRNAKDYKAWGESLYIKAFGAIANKRRLQAMDANTIDGLLNRITVFKIGLEDAVKNPAYHLPSAARVNALIDLITGPKRVNTIIWPGPDLEVQDIGSDGKVLEMDGRYAQVDKDILRALHVSPLLIDGGSSGTTARDWAALLASETGLDVIRDELEKIFTQIGRDIAIANAIDYTQLYYQFDTQLLKDEARVRQFALSMAEMGAISMETLVTMMGYDFPMEKLLREKEKADGTDLLFSNPNRPGINPVDPGGRPDDTTNKDLNKKSDPATVPDNNPSATLKAAIDDIGSYYALYLQAFDKISQGVKTQLDMGIDDPKMVKMSLISAFSGFSQLVESQITGVFRKHSGGNLTPELAFVLNWSRAYLDNFYATLETALNESTATLVSLLERSSYRVFLYAQESNVKAKVCGQIALAKIGGKTTATVVVNNEDSSCEFSLAGDKEYPLDHLLQTFPSHIGCSCTLKF